MCVCVCVCVWVGVGVGVLVCMCLFMSTIKNSKKKFCKEPIFVSIYYLS